MPQRHNPEEWKLADGTSLATYRVGEFTLHIFHRDDAVVAFGAKRRIDSSRAKIHMTSWHPDRGFTGSISTVGPHPDLGATRPADPANLNELADIIDRFGSAIPAPLKTTIVMTLRRK